MTPVHEQLRVRRRLLGLQQSDMLMRAGIPRQQYHRLEKGAGNPSLRTLELAAAGLNLALLLVPKERLREVQDLLGRPPNSDVAEQTPYPAIEDPWKGLLGNDDDD